MTVGGLNYLRFATSWLILSEEKRDSDNNMKERIPVLPFLSREKLSGILSRIPGKKDLIIDPNIIKPLENIVQISVLRYCNFALFLGGE